MCLLCEERLVMKASMGSPSHTGYMAAEVKVIEIGYTVLFIVFPVMVRLEVDIVI